MADKGLTYAEAGLIGGETAEMPDVSRPDAG
jgi:phosphoribosylaminoimidazole (AIR) synthetase